MVDKLHIKEDSEKNFKELPNNQTSPSKNVSKQALKPRRGMRTRYKVLIGAIILTIAALGFLIYSTPSPVQVPDVVGETLDVAKEKIEVAGLVVGDVKEEASTEYKEGTVIRTSPGANTSRMEGSKVDIFVARVAMVTVPNLIGSDADSAQKELEDLGFKVTLKKEYSDTVEEGYVIKTDPVANSSKEKGSTITVVVSKGVQPKTVPDVTGKSQDTAKQLLEAAGFIIGTISEEYSDSVAEGNVISTDPQANVELEKGSIVNMVVSKGKEIIMPDLVSAGYTYSEARNQLQSLGVTTIEKQEDRSYTTTTSDIVVGQYPAAGTVIDGPVTLYVSVATTSTNSTSTTGSSSSTSTSSSE